MKPSTLSRSGLLTSALMLATLTACGGSSGGGGDTANGDNGSPDGALNERPDFILGTIQRNTYDGMSDDLLTAGLGASGLGSAAAPEFADPANPTVAELRTRAIHGNYRALVPTAPGGGYGEFFGPHVSVNGTPSGDDGMIAGEEWLAYMQSGDGGKVVGMVQVPDSFDPAAPCMVTAPSSGSRGIYGAIGTAGEWGLKRGCAVAYTDKGTGTGAHNLTANTVQDINGRVVSATSPSAQTHFTAGLGESDRIAFDDLFPNRFAFKHAHSRQNPEKDWGMNVLQSVRFGLFVINEIHGERNSDGDRLASITADDTLVIASSVSNGGGASVLAAEMDRDGLIDGVAVSEPNVNPTFDSEIAIRQGDAPPLGDHSRSLLDYTSALAIYQGCASRAPEVRDIAPLNGLNEVGVNESTCAALAAKGLVTGGSLDEQASDALRILNEVYAIQPEQNLVAPANYAINVPQGIAVTYANTYSRASVTDNLCGFSFAATANSQPAAIDPAAERALFATSNGIPPTGGVDVVYNDADGGPTIVVDAVSPSSGVQDHALDGFLCIRSLLEGRDAVTGEALDDDTAARSDALQAGIEEIRASGDLRRKPAVFVTGRSDQILPINHTSRPYYALNQRLRGAASRLHYYEVLNAQHLDILNDFPGFDARFVPLHHYLFQALDLMYDHLRNGAELPPSQVVRTSPRGEGAPAITQANLTPIAAVPDEADRIVFSENVLNVPD